MKTNKLKTYFLAPFTVLFLFGCSDLKQPVEANLEPALSVHPDGWLSKSSSDFHGLFIRTDGWDLDNCQQCHGVDYMGGIAESSCITCHPGTPEDCTVCHGGVDNVTGAPPLDIDDNLNVSAVGVGSHTAHVEGKFLTDGVECSTCHIVPGVYDAAGHVDSDLPAEVVYQGLALLDGANPAWNTDSQSCSNAYCHGNWSLAKAESRFQNVYIAESMQGNNASPIWTDASSAPCGSCHGLPPQGHQVFELNQCSICHTTVNSAGEIIAPDKHINGMVNVFQQEYPIF